ncbi:MAG: asparagine synthase (glutamine-hydrolyzing) [Agriterribacter sp.]
MCGIAGILYLKGQNAERDTVVRMTNAIAHRGPDAEGIFTEKEIGLGHRRLSIIDLSSAANQPFEDNSGRYVIVFNGEMYNYNDVKKLIQDYAFKTTSDTEVLLAAYIKSGISCLDHFRGMYAFAIWDRQEKELCLVRDKMGVKPLYYYVDEEKIIFASEIRAILATGLVSKKINKKAVLEFLSYQSVSFPFTMVESIYQLDAGSAIKIKNGEIEIKKYWTVFDKEKLSEKIEGTEIKKNIYQLLGNSIQQRLVSDVPVGAFLSGGIDSSIVVGLMAELCGIKPNTFNISFTEKAFDESVYAEMIAKKFKAHHTRIQLSPAIMLEEMENALNAMDTPSGDGINTFVVSKAIKRAGITVALSGVGGDELFAGYPIFEQFRKLHAKRTLWKNTNIIRSFTAAVLPGKLSNKRSRLRQLLKVPSPDIEYIYPLLRQLITPEQINNISYLNDSQQTALSKTLSDYKNHLHLLPVLSQVSAAEYLGYTQHTLLKDTDQMSMAVALEVREPFFDTDLVQYVLSIPDKLKQPVYPKSLLVESVKPLLPDEIVFRKKQGFVFPWKLWMKNELNNFCVTHLERLGEREFIKKDALLSYWNNFLKGDPSIRWMDIWVFVVLEYWLEKNGIN